MEFKYHGIHFNNGGSKIADASSSKIVLINDDIMKSLLLLSKMGHLLNNSKWQIQGG